MSTQGLLLLSHQSDLSQSAPGHTSSLVYFSATLKLSTQKEISVISNRSAHLTPAGIGTRCDLPSHTPSEPLQHCLLDTETHNLTQVLPQKHEDCQVLISVVGNFNFYNPNSILAVL